MPALTLWLTGLGIKVIWNRPRTPQDNAKVERMQGVTEKWSRAKTCAGMGELRQNLEQACKFQREKYPTRVCKGLPRTKAFPRLAEGGRPYFPEQFDFEKVKQFLAMGMWERKVSQNGVVEFGNRRYSVGRKMAGQFAYISYHPDTHQWNFQDKHGKMTRLVPAEFTSESIQSLTAFQPKKVS